MQIVKMIRFHSHQLCLVQLNWTLEDLTCWCRLLRLFELELESGLLKSGDLWVMSIDAYSLLQIAY